MIKRIHLGLGLELETIDTDYAKTLTLINNEARRDQDLLFKLKKVKDESRPTN